MVKYYNFWIYLFFELCNYDLENKLNFGLEVKLNLVSLGDRMYMYLSDQLSSGSEALNNTGPELRSKSSPRPVIRRGWSISSLSMT